MAEFAGQNYGGNSVAAAEVMSQLRKHLGSTLELLLDDFESKMQLFSVFLKTNT
jgi:hypothetical protein